MARNKQQSRPERAASLERAREALEMRKNGHTFAAISERLGCSGNYAYKLVKQALLAIIQEPAEDVRALELERLDTMQHAMMEILGEKHLLVSSGAIISAEVLDNDGNPVHDDLTGAPKKIRLTDAGPKFAAVTALIKIAERRAKLLGLDAPTKTAFTDPDGKESKNPPVLFYLPTNGRDVPAEETGQAGVSEPA